tara:strand:- start:160 stop:438 length:279 start_codon:yes stop_codon:yes gene_type:complete
MSLRFVAVYEFWKIKLKFMALADCVRTLHFTKFTLEALVHYLCGFYIANFPDVPIVAVVNEGKKGRETIAVFEAHSTAVANFECSFNFSVQS